MPAISGTDAQILEDRLPGYLKFLDAGVLSWGPQCVSCSHHTSGTFSFEVTFTRAAVHCWRISVRMHFKPTLGLLYAVTFNRTWTVLLFTFHGEETVLCCVRWEGHTAFNCQCFSECVRFFSVHLTSVSRLSEFAVRKCFKLKLRSIINPYSMSFFSISHTNFRSICTRCSERTTSVVTLLLNFYLVGSAYYESVPLFE